MLISSLRPRLPLCGSGRPVSRRTQIPSRFSERPPTRITAASEPASAPVEPSTSKKSDANDYQPPAAPSHPNANSEKVTVKSLARPFVVIVVASVLSKIIGLFREVSLASTFGLHPSYDAFGYSVLLPAFFLTLYGGLNGPIHQAATVALTQQSQSPANSAPSTRLFDLLSSHVLRWSLGLSLLIAVLAPFILQLTAPGLQVNGTLQIATAQLQLMAPVALFSGSLGLTGAALQAKGQFITPSLSPAITSLAIVAALWLVQPLALPLEHTSIVLALAYTAGALLQALVQRAFLPASPPAPLPPSAADRAALKVFQRRVRPALLSTGLTQLSVQLDLWVASFVAGACAAMSFANLLFMSVTGVISTALIGPLSSRLSAAANKGPAEFSKTIFAALDVALTATIPLTILVAPVSFEITSLLFLRGSFSPADCTLVSTLLMLYVLGSVPYLLRDIAIRVFYASKSDRDVDFPATLGWIGLALRLPLDWLLALKLSMGAAGLVVSTTLINSCLALISLARVKPYLRAPETPTTSPTLFIRALNYATASAAAYLTANFCYSWGKSAVLSALQGVEGGFTTWFARGVCLSGYFIVALAVYAGLVFAAKRTWTRTE